MFLTDFRFGLRMLFKEPGFTAVAIVTLALGIGANAAIFSVVDGVLLRPLPYPEPDRLVTVWSAMREGDDAGDIDVVSPANFHDWQRENRSFSGLAASFGRSFNLTGADVAERLLGVEVSPNFFPVMGVDAQVGRTFSLGDFGESERTAVLSFGLWQRHFGGDPEIVGSTATLNGELYDVVGVMPPWFRFGGPSRGGRTRDCEVWVRAPRGIPEPLASEPEDLTTVRSLGYLRVMGRLESGVALAEARAEMNVIARRLEEEYPDSNTNSISGNFNILVEGRPDPQPGEEFAPGYQSVSPDYFQSMGIPLMEGRDFNSRDHDKAPSVVIVNQSMAEIIWPGESPVGKRISFDKEDWIEVVGVVGDVHHYALGEKPRPELYLPYMQATLPFMTFVIRTDSEPQALAGALRTEIRDLDPNLPVYGMTTLREALSESVARPRFQMILLGGFGVLALVLATVGIYGLMAYSVSKSTREIGIRMALGARASEVRLLVLRRAMGLAVAGLGMGWIGALGFTRFLSSFLYQVAPADLTVFGWVSVLLAVVALAACLIPAGRASRVEPITALRLE